MTWHRHVWKVVEKQVLPSTLDKLLEHLEQRHLTKFENADDVVDVIVTSRCEVCGTEKVERL